MKKEILDILEDSGTMPAILSNRPIGVYIWKKDVFVLKDGDDIPFDDMSTEDQTDIHNHIFNGNYVLDKDNTFQG